MSKNKVTHFEIPYSDTKKAKAFYEKIFDWKVDVDEEMEGYGMIMTMESTKDGMPTEMGGINGGFYKRTGKSDTPSVVVETDSIDDTLVAIEKAGGKIVTPRHAIGEWGFMADFTDPEGNLVGLWEKAMKK